MIRRRRPQREIPFSFDSFLDVVANVVGIILRLIIVAWAAGRSYHGPPPPAPPAPPTFDEPVALPEPNDPLAPELESQRRELALAQARLLEETRKWEGVHERRTAATDEVMTLVSHRRELESTAAATKVNGDRPALPLAEIALRSRQIAEEIAALKQAPSAKQTLRYRTPVSQALQSEELMFECKGGRVSLIDVGGLLEEVRQSVRSQQGSAPGTWDLSGTTPPVGAFRLRYQLERQATDSRLSLSEWVVEPVVAERGEPADAALTPGSAFRKVVDALDPQQTAVTFWVYPDSFPLYRKLRDLLHERDTVVAGRPLPDGVPIRSTKHGSASRGQ
jgi:hypothetical protein